MVPFHLWLLEVCMAVETDRQLIESGTALAQGLLTAHNRLSHNASLCSQLEKTMHIRKLSLANAHTCTHILTLNTLTQSLTHTHTQYLTTYQSPLLRS